MKMNINEKLKFNEEGIFNNFFIIHILILLILINIEVISWEILLERIIKIYGLLIGIVLLRRILIRSRKFRYLVLYIRKYYFFLFIKRWCFNIYDYVNFSLFYIRFYLIRFLKYFLVGTKIKWLTPYRKNWKKNEIILNILEQIIMLIQYIILYILKLFYEMILFFDTASIYKIIRSRILGFLIITIGYIILGIKFFIFYILSWVLGFFLWNIYLFYLVYNNDISNVSNVSNVSNTSDILDTSYIGDTPLLKDLDNLKIESLIFKKIEDLSKIKIRDLRIKCLLNHKVINLKILTKYNWNNLYKKYGGKQTTQYMLSYSMLELIKVEKKTKIYIEFFKKDFINEKNIEIINISKYEFITKFLEKKEWYENKDFHIVSFEDENYINKGKKVKLFEELNFLNAYLFINNRFINFFHYKTWFLFFFLSGAKWDENDNIIEKDWWNDFNYIQNYYYKRLNNYFEFKDIIDFVKEIENRIKKEGGTINFYKKYYFKNNINIEDTIRLTLYLKHKNIISKKEIDYVEYILGLFVYFNLDMDLNLYKKEIEELNLFYKNEIFVLGFLHEDFRKFLLIIEKKIK